MKQNSIPMIKERKKVCIIVNPVSGTTTKQDIPQKAQEELTSDRFDVQIIRTEYQGHGYKLAQQAVSDNIDYVIAVGGDGTVNEIGSALINTDTTLGIIPLGSGNGLARDLSIPTNATKALRTIAEEHIKEIDYGKANGRPFFCTCGVGFDALVAEKAGKATKRGTLMYLKNMLEIFFKQKPKNYEIVCPEGTIREKAFVVTCANASQYGYNAHIAPHADIQDGMLNIAILQPLTILDVPKTTVQLFTRNIDENKKMLELVTKNVLIKREEEGVMHIDGDPINMGREINVEIVPKGLKVLVPQKPIKRNLPDPLENILQTIKIKI